MNIDHGVRNSIYRTGRAATLRARLTRNAYYRAPIRIVAEHVGARAVYHTIPTIKLLS
jgi:hypothetical protein